MWVQITHRRNRFRGRAGSSLGQCKQIVDVRLRQVKRRTGIRIEEAGREIAFAMLRTSIFFLDTPPHAQLVHEDRLMLSEPVGWVQKPKATRSTRLD
jgi:hypothetical protein